MGDQDHRRPGLAVEVGDLAADRGPERGIEAGERLVEQENLGPDDQRPRQRRPAASARPRAWPGSGRGSPPGRASRRSPDPVRRSRLDPTAGPGGRRRCSRRRRGAGRRPGPGRPSPGRDRAGQAVDPPAAEPDAPGVERFQPRDQAEERALARPRRADEYEQLAALDGEVDPPRGDDPAPVGLVDARGVPAWPSSSPSAPTRSATQARAAADGTPAAGPRPSARSRGGRRRRVWEPVRRRAATTLAGRSRPRPAVATALGRRRPAWGGRVAPAAAAASTFAAGHRAPGR